MKKFLKKILLLLIIITVSSTRPILNFIVDTFNIFHINNIRFTEAEPNKNFIKTKYILKNKKKFNAFIFGSSIVANIPKDSLLKDYKGYTLNWYNMTYSEGTPKENFLTLKTLVNGGVDVKIILLAFDAICLYRDYEDHSKQFLRMPYQEYEKDSIKFYCNYLKPPVNNTILREVLYYSSENNKENSKLFYEYGTHKPLLDIDFNVAVNSEKYKADTAKITKENVWQDLFDINNFCTEKGIKLILITNPMFITNYENWIKSGYLDFLEEVSKNCEFNYFSGISKYTTDPHYFYDWAHYKAFVGNEINKVIFGNEEEKSKAKKDASLNKTYEELFGIKVTNENFSDVRGKIENQFNDYEKSYRNQEPYMIE